MQQYHFIAIGGAVMHQLAIMLQQQGNVVSGSDDAIFEPARSNLKASGLLPDDIGWYPEKIQIGLNAVVLGMHAKSDNPELVKARELGIKIYSFPEFIYEQSLSKKRIVIAGSHGKTTTTSMIMHVLNKSGKEFDYLVGAKIAGFDNMVQVSNAPMIIIEGDEYLTSPMDLRSKFLHYHPHIAVLTGIAWDHINVFPTYESYLNTFRAFINSIEEGGTLIYNSEDDEVIKLLNSLSPNIHLQPYRPFEYIESEKGTAIYYEGETLDLEIFGQHNISNLSAAAEVCALLQIPILSTLKASASFTGAARRLEKIVHHPEKGIIVYRDFAHAPSKVKATMAAVKAQHADKKVLAVLELHTYSSLQENFIPHFAKCLDPADEAAVFLDEEAFRIKGQPMLAADKVIAGFERNDLQIIYEKNGLLGFLKQQPTTDIVVLLMSSGSFGGFSPQEFWDIKDS